MNIVTNENSRRNSSAIERADNSMSRRSFLQKAALAGAGTVAVGVLANNAEAASGGRRKSEISPFTRFRNCSNASCAIHRAFRPNPALIRQDHRVPFRDLSQITRTGLDGSLLSLPVYPH